MNNSYLYQNFIIEILYEDNDIAILNKPSGLLTHKKNLSDSSPSLAESLKMNFNIKDDEVLKDLNNREKLVLIPLAFLVVFFGLYPSPVISLISSSSENLVDILNLYFNDKLSMELKN